MSANEFFSSVVIVLGVMAAVAGIETIAPLFAAAPSQRGRRAANLGLTVATLALNWGLAAAAGVLALALPLREPGLMTDAGLPPAAQIVASVVLLDFSFGYLAHRAMHWWPMLWRVHRVHHGDPFVDVTTAYRTHPLEVGWRFLFLIVPVWALGIPATAVVTYRLLSAVNAMFEHANLRLWQPLDGVVSLIWVTPNMHKVHHSRVCVETDSNYGNLFSLADRLLGTFTPTQRAAAVRYGLDDDAPVPVESVVRLFALPFGGRTEPSAAVRSVGGHQAVSEVR